MKTHVESVKLEPLAKLVPHPRNPNKHPESQTKALAKIIEAQGWRAPIVVSNLSGFIIAGHGRYQAAQLLGLEKVPVNRQDFESEAMEWAHMIADNRLAELADMDSIGLGELIRDLDLQDFDLALTGFNELSEVPGLDEGDNMGSEEGQDFGSQFGVIVMCGDEAEQETVFKRLEKEGFNCKVVCT